MSGSVGRLRATLGLDSAEFSKNLRGARQEAQSFQSSLRGLSGLAGGVMGTLGIGLSTTALISGVRSAVSALSSLGKQARDTGMDVEELQGLVRGFSRNTRVSAEQIGGAFEKFAQNVGQALEGAGPLASVFDRLEISVRDANGEVRSQRALLDDVARAMRRARSEQERTAIASAAFGAAGRQMASAMAAGPEALAAMVDEARAAGDIIDRNLIHRAEILDDKFDTLTRRVGTFFQTLAVGAVAGGVETATDTLTRMFGTLERAQAILGDGVFQALIAETGELSALDGVSDRMERVARNSDLIQAAALRAAAAMSDVTSQLSDIGRNDELLAFDEIINGMEQLVAELRRGEIAAEDFEERLEATAREAIGALHEMQAIDGLSLSESIRQIMGLVSALDAARVEARGLRAELPGGSPGTTEGTPLSTIVMPQDLLDGRRAGAPRRPPNNIDFGLPPVARAAGGGGGGSAQVNEYEQAVTDIRARTDALIAEAAALAEVAASGREYADAAEFARTKAELLTAALAVGRADTPALRAEIDELAEAYIRAGGEVDALTEAMRRQQEAGERGAQALADIFIAAAQGGDAGRQAVIRLIAEIARMEAMRGFQGMLAGGGGGGIFMRALGSLIGKNARGTASWRGGPTLLHEEGPEIIDLPVGTKITPALESKRLMREGGGGAQQVDVRVHVDQDGNWHATVERISDGRIRQAAPGIVSRSVQGVYQANSRNALR